MTTIITPTVAELEAERAEILAAWPRLAEIDLCCGGCNEDEAAHIYGWGPATNAMIRLSNINWLLGG